MVETATGHVRLTEQCVGLLTWLGRVSFLTRILILTSTLVLATLSDRALRIACPVARLVAGTASAVRLCLLNSLTPLVEGKLRLETIRTFVGWAYSLFVVALTAVKGE